MGAPKRNRLTYEKPKERWNLERIKTDRSLISEYGLKNMKELWKAQTEVSRVRRNARVLLSSMGTGSENVKERIIGRLTKMGIVAPGTTLDSLLDLKENDLLNRRLQTVVFRKGMARSMKQARQLTVHGFIAIDGRKVSKPGYLVDVETEKHISYYKPIDIMPPKPEETKVAEPETPSEQQAEATPEPEPKGNPEGNLEDNPEDNSKGNLEGEEKNTDAKE